MINSWSTHDQFMINSSHVLKSSLLQSDTHNLTRCYNRGVITSLPWPVDGNGKNVGMHKRSFDLMVWKGFHRAISAFSIEKIVITQTMGTDFYSKFFWPKSAKNTLSGVIFARILLKWSLCQWIFISSDGGYWMSIFEWTFAPSSCPLLKLLSRLLISGPLLRCEYYVLQYNIIWKIGQEIWWHNGPPLFCAHTICV